MLRRVDLESEYNSSKQTTVSYRDLVIEKENRVVRRGDEIIELTKREYELLLTLMENVNVVLARDVLLKEVWGYESLDELYSLSRSTRRNTARKRANNSSIANGLIT